MNHQGFVRSYRERFPSSRMAQALLDEQIVLGGYYFWRGRTSDGRFLVTVLQSKAWSACERYLDALLELTGTYIRNRRAHPAWEDTYAAAHSADIWQHFHDGASVFVEPVMRLP